MSNVYVKKGTVWTFIPDGGELYVKNGSTWQKPKEVWVNKNGTWVKVWQNVSLNAIWAGQYYESRYSGFSDTASASLEFRVGNAGSFAVIANGADTLISQDVSPTGNWLTGGSPSNYQVLISHSTVSGIPSVTNGASSWSSLGTSRSLTTQVNAFGTPRQAEGTVTIQIRNASTLVVEASGTLSYTISATPQGGGPI